MHGLALIFMYLCTFVSASSWPPVAMAHVHYGMWRAGSCCRVSTVTQLMSCPWTSPHLRLETLLSLGWERKREREIFCGLVWDLCGLLQGKPCNSLLCVWFSLNYDEETGILLENNNIFFVRLCVSVYLYVCVCVVRAVIWRPMCGTCALDRTFNLSRATSLTSTAWSGSYSFKKLKWITVSWFYKWKMDHFFDRH